MVDTSRETPSGTEHLNETECWWLLSRAEVVTAWTPDPKNTYVQIQPSEAGRRFARGHKTETIWYW